MNPDIEKWQLCPDRECPYCEKVIMDKDVEEWIVVTRCPYCNRSFTE